MYRGRLMEDSRLLIDAATRSWARRARPPWEIADGGGQRAQWGGCQNFKTRTGYCAKVSTGNGNWRLT
eukprot:1341534-Pyramimonas_sp.AAC.1